MKTSISKWALLLLLGSVVGARAQSGKRRAVRRPAQVEGAPAGALLEPAKIFDLPKLNTRSRWALDLNVGTNLKPRASLEFGVRGAYVWKYFSAGWGLLVKSGRYGAIRATPNNEGELPDPTLYVGETARPRGDDDRWTLTMLSLDLGVRGPLLFSTTSNFYQAASFSLGVGRARDAANALSLSTAGFTVGAGLGYQFSRNLAAEYRLVYNWIEATAPGADSANTRRLPLLWLSNQLGIKISF